MTQEKIEGRKAANKIAADIIATAECYIMIAQMPPDADGNVSVRHLTADATLKQLVELTMENNERCEQLVVQDLLPGLLEDYNSALTKKQ